MNNVLDFGCGLVAGWSQIITGQPLDFIKTKFQISRHFQASTMDFVREIISQHGFKGFYRGSSSLFFGFSFTIALQFAIYETCKKYLARGEDFQNRITQEVLSIKQIMLSGGFVGFAVSFFSCPVQYAKIQKQTSSHNIESALRILLRQICQNRLQNIYRGFGVAMAREVIGSAFYYGNYEMAVRKICIAEGLERRQADSREYLLAGSIAGLSYWTVGYPLDVIKTRIQSGIPRTHILQNLHKFAYRGFSVIALRSVLVNGTSFAVFEKAKQFSKMISLSHQ